MSIERGIGRVVNKFGYLLRRKTHPALIRKLVATLRPMTTEHLLVRIGGDEDGAYLVPDDFTGIIACFSPGVSDSSTFEKDLYVRDQIPSFLADWSVEAPSIDIPNATFVKKYLGTRNNDQFITLDDWVFESIGDQRGDLILQMDIEGAEYQVLRQTPPRLLSRFRIVIMELHHLNRLAEPEFFDLFSEALSGLIENYTCVHIHPNNYCEHFTYAGMDIPYGLEITFLRNDRVARSAPADQFPHALDIINFRDRPDTPLPLWWYADDERPALATNK